MRVVVDTNVLISGLFWKRGAGAKILYLRKKGNVLLVISEELLSELDRVLTGFKIRMPTELREETIDRFRGGSVLVDPPPVRVSRDPDDDKLLAAAVAGNAQYLVTYDKDLLVLDPHQGVRIMTPGRFLSELRL